MANLPLKLDWNDLLPQSKEQSPPPEVEVVGGSQWSGLSDRDLHDKIRRIADCLNREFTSKLPDRGAKLRSNLRQLQTELDSRKLDGKRKIAGENGMARQSRTTESSGTFCDSSPSCTPTEANMNSSFVSLFSEKMEQRADPSCNGACRSTNRVNSESLKNNGQLHERRERARAPSPPARISCRSSPFLCVSSLSKKDKQDSSANVCKITESSNSLSEQRSFLISSSKRKRASDDRHGLDSRSKKVQVVLLDEEEPETKQQKLLDAHDDRKETKVYYPSRDDPECIELSTSDIECLEPERYITSPIMNFYIRYLRRPLSPIGKPRGEYHFFNTYFFSKLEEAVSSCKGDRDERFMKLRRWFKGVNIFQKAYIFLPIHGDLHWSLVIICVPAKEDESGPIVLHLDSLGFHASTSILDMVICYLKEEWNNLNQNGPPPDLPISERIWANLPRRIEKKKLMVPQQKNEYDCGLFVLYFMERFIEEAPERLKKKDLDMFGSKWFQPEEASGLRKRIKDLLVEEFENAKFESGRELESPTSSSNSLENVEQCIDLNTIPES